MAVRPPDDTLEEEAAADSAAQKEERNFDILDEIEKAKRKVTLAIHKVLAWLIPISVILAFVLFWVGIVVYAIQLFTPRGWMNDDQIHELRTVLFSGVVGAVVSQGIKRYLD